jgi:hypothetical protein
VARFLPICRAVVKSGDPPMTLLCQKRRGHIGLHEVTMARKVYRWG